MGDHSPRIVYTAQEKVRSEHEKAQKERSCFPLHLLGWGVRRNNSLKDVSSGERHFKEPILILKKKRKVSKSKKEGFLHFRELLLGQPDCSSS